MALCALPLAAQGATSTFAVEGKRYFLANKPMEAAPLLERAVSANPADEDSRLWLGYSYEQLGRLDDAVAAYRAGAARSGPRKHVFLFNMANCFAAQGKAAFAEEAYGQAIAVKPDWAPPYLNRANARMRQGSLQEAAADYRVYLSLDPATPQAEEIRRLLALLGGEIEAAQARAAEAEARRLADEAARQALMDEVARSLLEAAQDTTSLSAGGEDVQGYVDPLELDD